MTACGNLAPVSDVRDIHGPASERNFVGKMSNKRCSCPSVSTLSRAFRGGGISTPYRYLDLVWRSLLSKQS